jgi:hypothetical protein
MTLDYQDLLIAFAIDAASISLLTYALYFRRHQRRDLTLGFMGVNVGLFAVSSFTTTTSISIGFGIGLFALLSVVRLRSTVASQEEIGYYFVALVLGLVNGLGSDGQWGVTITLNLMLLGVMFVVDHPRVLPHAEHQRVLIDRVPQPLDTLQGELEDLLGYEVTRMRVLDIDFAHERMRVDVRFRTDRPVAPGGRTGAGDRAGERSEEVDR